MTPLAALLVALATAAAPAAEGATPVTLVKGERLELCKSGLVAVCPVAHFICDDPRVATVEQGAAGAELLGVGPGRTLCAVHGFEMASRRLLAVTVQQPPAGR